jgi:hypothetical protein
MYPACAPSASNLREHIYIYIYIYILQEGAKRGKIRTLAEMIRRSGRTDFLAKSGERARSDA